GEGAQIDDLDGQAVAFQRSRGHFCAVHNGTVGDNTDLTAFSDHSCLAKRNRKISTWVFRAIVRLTVKMLVLQEHHGIVAAYGGSQQSSDVQRRGGHNHAEPGTMRKDRFAALAV